MSEDQNQEYIDKMQFINSALEYTDGDMDKARLMAGGQFNDVHVLKMKFQITDADTYGVVIIFINTFKLYTANLEIYLLSNSELFNKVNVFDNWKIYYSVCKQIEASEDIIDPNDIQSHLFNSIEDYDLFTDVIEKDLERINDTLNDIIKKFYEISEIESQIEIEETNSLALKAKKVPILIPGKSEAESKDDDIDDDRPYVEKEADYVIEGEAIVSPVKGKYIRDIKRGDVLRIQLVNKEGISKKVAVAYDAITDTGKFLPIKGRVKEKIPFEKGGFTIYCLVAKGILAKVVEEENIKVETIIQKSKEEEKKKANTVNLSIYIVLLLVLLVISIVIIYVLV